MTLRRRSLVLWVAAAVLVALITHDLIAPNGRGYAARASIAVIDQYRALVSPHLRGRVTCRFHPTCSAYGRATYEKYGFAVGSFKTAWRVLRCGPWTASGTTDLP